MTFVYAQRLVTLHQTDRRSHQESTAVTTRPGARVCLWDQQRAIRQEDRRRPQAALSAERDDGLAQQRGILQRSWLICRPAAVSADSA
jgi:hypothetical protein